MVTSEPAISTTSSSAQSGELADLMAIAQAADADTLTFVFRHRIIVQERVPLGGELTLGRFNIQAEGQLDLTPYDGVTLGTSRLHSRIRHDENGWWIGDLGSSNGTWLNRLRLEPFHGYRLDIKNHMLLGNLALQILLPHKIFSGVAIPVNSGPSKPFHVVHIEEDRGMREVLKLSFEQAEPNLILRQFSKGEEALLYIEAHAQTIDLFMLDIRLSGKMSGIDVAHNIRFLGCPGNIILSSANWEPSEEILTSLNCEYLPKPRHVLDTVPKLNHYRLPDPNKSSRRQEAYGDTRKTQLLDPVVAEQIARNARPSETIPEENDDVLLSVADEIPSETIPKPVLKIQKPVGGKSLVEKLISRLKRL